MNLDGNFEATISLLACFCSGGSGITKPCPPGEESQGNDPSLVRGLEALGDLARDLEML